MLFISFLHFVQKKNLFFAQMTGSMQTVNIQVTLIVTLNFFCFAWFGGVHYCQIRFSIRFLSS